MRHNDTGRRGAITNDVLKFRKIIDFQCLWIVMNRQWIVYSYTEITWFTKSMILPTFFKTQEYVLHQKEASKMFYLYRLLWNLEIHRFTKIVNFDTAWIIPIPVKFLYISEKDMDPVTFTGWEKNVFAKCLCLFLKW